MKVICISDFYHGIEIGQIFDGEIVFEDDGGWINNYLRLDGIQCEWYPTEFFMKLEDYRLKKLEDLGI